MSKKKPASKSSKTIPKSSSTTPNKLKLKKSLPKKKPYKGWNLLKHGVSQSLLQKFIVCRDRYHKHTVQSLKETTRKEAMEYGSIFHKLIEWGAEMGNSYTRLKMTKKCNTWIKKYYPTSESALLARIAVAQYHQYREWERTKPTYKYIAQEPVFKEKYPLPAVNFKTDEISINIPRKDIIIRGRIDEVIDINGDLWLQENKTKGRIDLAFISDTVPENLQVMFYSVAAELLYSRPVKGFIYNIIRKPGQRQRQKESDDAFIERITEEIKENFSYYFYRLEYTFKPGAIEKWKREELNPLLYTVYMWWRSIERNPTQPWEDADGNVNPFHGRRSFGVYDSMSQGKGDFYDLIVHGRTHGLAIDHNMFPELEDDD